MAITTTNPATGEVLKRFDPMTPEEIEQRLARAVTGFDTLRRTPFAQRAAWLPTPNATRPRP
jgi:succinate-semialdehyde dehydrogenase/glutarate-semialdehyde dehydrogenase